MGILGSIAESRRAETILTPGDLEKAIRRVYGGGETFAGIEVSPAMALRWAPFGISVRVISETVSQLPMHVFVKTDSDGTPGRRELSSHWLALLLDRPNDFQTGQEFFEWALRQAVSVGDALAFKVRDGVDKIRELLPIPTYRIHSVAQKEDWSVVYSITQQDGTIREFGSNRIFHLRGPSHDGVVGINPVIEYKETIALGIAQDRHAGTIFGNGGMPRGFLETPANMNTKARQSILDAVKEQTGGNRSNSWYILPGGMTARATVINPSEAQLLDSRKLQRGIVAALLRVPLHMVGDLEKASFSSIESLARQFVDYSLMPWIIRLEKAAKYQLISSRAQAQGIFVKLSLNSLLRGNSRERSDFYHKGRLDGWLSGNEIRRLEDMDAVDGLDDYWRPVNVEAVTEETESAETVDEEELMLRQLGQKALASRDYEARLGEAMANGH